MKNWTKEQGLSWRLLFNEYYFRVPKLKKLYSSSQQKPGSLNLKEKERENSPLQIF